MNDQQFYGFDDSMFSSQQRVDFFSIKNGEGQLRILPPYAQGQLFHKVDLHWGFTDENGKKKALKCTLYSHKSCPICKEHDRLKGEVELLKNTPTGMSVAEINKQIEDLEKRAGDIKRKPTYLWNMLSHEGAQKVLQLSWNGHDPLLQKIKFYWEKKKINVTDPTANYSIWFQRSGQAAKTRYQYEVLEQSVMKLTNLQPLIDLSKVYKDSTPSELEAIVKAGYVGLPSEDPNDRNFAAEMPSGLGNAAAPATNQQSAPVNTQVNTQQNLNVGQNVQQNASHSNVPVNSNHNPGQFTQQTTTTLNPQQQQTVDEETERMKRILAGG